MRQRIVTGIVFGIFVLALLFSCEWSRIILLIAIPILATNEYLDITARSNTKLLTTVFFKLLAIGIAGLLYWALQSGYSNNSFFVIGIGAMILTNIVLIINLYLNKPIIQHKSMAWVLAIVYILLPFVFAMHTGWQSSFVLLMATIFLIWISDSGAYFVGSRIGKTKLFPKISPGKTWEGFLGGGLLTLIAAYVIFSLTEVYSVQFGFIFGLIVWIFGTWGDLVASHVKRIVGVKDSGTLLPGHGGFYDRFDSIIFVIPFLLLFMRLWG